MANKPTAELLHLYGQWKAIILDEEQARDLTVAKVSELVAELATRGEAHSGMSRAVDTIGQRYRTLDLELNRVMATGVRPVFPALRSGVGASSIASQSSDSGAYSISSTGLGMEHHPNVGSSRGAGGSSNGSAPAASDTIRALRTPIRTRYCGRVTAVPAVPVFRAPRANHQDKSSWHLKCINCKEAFRDHRAVWSHFPGCVEERGNPTGACWFDHASIEVDNIPESLIHYVSHEERCIASEC